MSSATTRVLGYRRTGLPAWIPALTLTVFGCVAALLLGAVSGLGSPMLVAPFLGIGAVVLLVALPAVVTVWALVVLSLFVVGPVIYYASVESVRWLPPLLAAALLLPFFVQRLRASAKEVHTGLPPHVAFYVAFLVVATITSVFASPRLAEAVFAFRTYYAYLPLALVVMYGLVQPASMERIWRFLLICSFVQLPFALFQILVVARGRINREALQDVVTGTFPGNLEQGGANAGLAVFTLTACLVAISLWRAKKLGTLWMLAVSLSCLAVIVLAEVKAVVLMIPIALALLFWREIGRQPLKALGLCFIGLVVAAGVMVSYQKLYYSSATADWSSQDKPLTPLESIRNQFDPQLAQRGAVVGRMAAYADWWHKTARADEAIGLFTGYGVGSTQYGRLGIGKVMQRLKYAADNTASGLLLWDTGLVGHAFVLLSFGLAGVWSLRLARHAQVPVTHQAILHAVGVALFIHVLNLPYKDFMFRTAPSQVLMFFMLGYVAYWWRAVSQPVRRPVGI